ncbi:hypothetical protein KHQ81_11315 [Mycoplasmatota bacterium]|nr:hypothetical protein KHQ81_11315 [Mycoplasmatota bacterium]
MKYFNKWWSYVIIVLILFIPSYSTIAYNPENTQDVIKEVLSSPLIYNNNWIYGMIKIIFIFILLLSIYNTKYQKILNGYFILLFLVTALFQTTAYTENFGFVILTGNAILNLIVCIFWYIQAVKSKPNQIKKSKSNLKYGLIFLAFIAFYFPVNSSGINIDFSLKNLLINNSMVTFCMITPVALTINLFLINKINFYTLRVTGFIGIIFGIINMITWFILNPKMTLMGIVHIPLLVISLYAFVISNQYIKED